MVMPGEFEDFIDPLIIMFYVLFSVVGAIWAFLLTAIPLNLMSFIGVIMLRRAMTATQTVLISY